MEMGPFLFMDSATKSIERPPAGMAMKKALVLASVLVAALVAPPAYNLYLGARAKAGQPCLNTLRQIEGAKNSWVLEMGASPGANVTLSNILPFLAAAPSCHVAGASYIIGKVGEEPRCRVHGTPSHFKPD